MNATHDDLGMTTSQEPAAAHDAGSQISHGPITRAVVAVVMACAHRRWTVLIVTAVLMAVSTWYVVERFGDANDSAINTNTDDFIAASVPWRQDEIAYDKAFPNQGNDTIVVVDGKTPELADQAVTALFAKLQNHPDLFHSVVRPDGGPFFARNGLLFQSTDEVKKAVGGLMRARSVLGIIASDPSLRGVFDAFAYIPKGVQAKQGSFDQFKKPIQSMNGALENVLADKPAFFSWQNLLSNGEAPGGRQLRKFIEVAPVLDYADIQPGAKASDFIRQQARDLHLDAAHGVDVRMTGQVPISDAEFATVLDGFGLNGLFMIAAVILIVYAAVKSLKLVGAVLLTVMIGLVVTFAAGLVLVHQLNVLSIAFAVLFVGIGVDFGIQFSVRFKAERYDHADFFDALHIGAAKVGRPLALAALATMAGFYAFLPTAYKGVADLGEIAGTGMLIAFACSITILPALLSLIRPPAEREPVGYKFLAPVDDFIERHRYVIVIGTLAVAIAGTPLLRDLRFDFNPLNLDNQNSEAISTLLSLMKDPDTDTQTINVLEPNLTSADFVAGKLRDLPDVARVTTLTSLVPTDQDEKLQIIGQAAKGIGPVLNPQAPLDPPSDEDVVQSIRRTASAFANTAGDDKGEGPEAARRFAELAGKLADAAPAARQRAAEALVPPLKTTLQTLRDSLQAGKVSIDDIPASLKNLYISQTTGQARVRGGAEGRPRRQRQHDQVRDADQNDRRARQRSAGVDPGGRQDGEARFHGGGHHRHRLDLHHPVDRPEAGGRRAADPGAAAARRLRDPGNHGADRHAAELRQHHRAAAAARARRRLQDLLRDGVARLAPRSSCSRA